MQSAQVLPSTGPESAELGTESPKERDLLYMHELIGGRPYSKTPPMTKTERARHLRSIRRHILQTRCNGDETVLASDLAIYATVNGPATLSRIWRDRERARDLETVTIQ